MAGQVSCSEIGVAGTPGCPLACAEGVTDDGGDGGGGSEDVTDEDGDTSDGAETVATPGGEADPLVTGDELPLFPAVSQATNDTVVTMAANPTKGRNEKSFLMFSPCRALPGQPAMKTSGSSRISPTTSHPGRYKDPRFQGIAVSPEAFPEIPADSPGGTNAHQPGQP